MDLATVGRLSTSERDGRRRAVKANRAEGRSFIAEVRLLLARLGEEVECLGEELSAMESSSCRASVEPSEDIVVLDSFADTLGGLQGLAGDVRVDVERLQLLLFRLGKTSLGRRGAERS